MADWRRALLSVPQHDTEQCAVRDSVGRIGSACRLSRAKHYGSTGRSRGIRSGDGGRGSSKVGFARSASHIGTRAGRSRAGHSGKARPDDDSRRCGSGSNSNTGSGGAAA